MLCSCIFNIFLALIFSSLSEAILDGLWDILGAQFGVNARPMPWTPPLVCTMLRTRDTSCFWVVRGCRFDEFSIPGRLLGCICEYKSLVDHKKHCANIVRMFSGLFFGISGSWVVRRCHVDEFSTILRSRIEVDDRKLRGRPDERRIKARTRRARFSARVEF